MYYTFREILKYNTILLIFQNNNAMNQVHTLSQTEKYFLILLVKIIYKVTDLCLYITIIKGNI